MFPQARKHCRNGDADTDCDWDNKQNKTTRNGKIEGKRHKKSKKDKKKQERQKKARRAKEKR
ncbi:MAG: hypothetical protein ACOH2E_08400 [Candidatus Paracaedibacter sp.]